MSDLKLCPFCGGPAWERTDDDVVCTDPECAAGNIEATRDDWNRRPLEDAVRKVCEEMRRYASADVEPQLRVLSAAWAASLERAMEGKP